MDTPKRPLFCWLSCLVVGGLAGGCASSASTHRENAPEERETAEQPPDESAYKDAADKLLKFLAKQQKTGTGVIQASGKDGIYPVYECMEHGCPDRVFCEEFDAYCHVTHCGKKSCSFCPEPFPEALKNLVFKQWCQFDCLRGSVRSGTALGFVPSVGKGLFIGPYCISG